MFLAPPPARSLLAFAGLWVAACALALPARATDPARRMEETCAPADRYDASGRGMWGYADASGEYALVTGAASLQIIDVTDPTHPQIASYVQSVGGEPCRK